VVATADNNHAKASALEILTAGIYVFVRIDTEALLYFPSKLFLIVLQVTVHLPPKQTICMPISIAIYY
jgi:hypothetical protein